MTIVKMEHVASGTELTPQLLKNSFAVLMAAATNIQQNQLAADFEIDVSDVRNAVPRSGGEVDEIFCDNISGVNITDLDRTIRKIEAALTTSVVKKANITVSMAPNGPGSLIATGAAQEPYSVLGGDGEQSRTLRINAPEGFSGISCLPLLNDQSVVKFAPGGFIKTGKPVYNEDYVEFPIDVGGSNCPWGIEKEFVMQVIFQRIGAL